ncbi:hypothetical protein HZB01_01690 [Candidatus Woesearchaeota archaeon]|nr:hypothetical protein [Candidatus Woesearchaeota archaeon]
MKIIVDTNQIIAALVKDGLTRKIITSKNLLFYAPIYVLEEVQKHLPVITKKAGIPKEDVKSLFSLFMENVSLISEEKINQKMADADKIMRDIDLNDSPILACALAIPNDGIWTEDKHFEKQGTVKVLKTKDMLRYI